MLHWASRLVLKRPSNPTPIYLHPHTKNVLITLLYCYHQNSAWPCCIPGCETSIPALCDIKTQAMVSPPQLKNSYSWSTCGCPWTDTQITVKSLVRSSPLPLVLEVTSLSSNGYNGWHTVLCPVLRHTSSLPPPSSIQYRFLVSKQIFLVENPYTQLLALSKKRHPFSQHLRDILTLHSTFPIVF